MADVAIRLYALRETLCRPCRSGAINPMGLHA